MSRSFACHGEYMLWRAAEGRPYPGDGDHAEAAEELADEYSEDATASDEFNLLAGSAADGAPGDPATGVRAADDEGRDDRMKQRPTLPASIFPDRN